MRRRKGLERRVVRSGERRVCVERNVVVCEAKEKRRRKTGGGGGGGGQGGRERRRLRLVQCRGEAQRLAPRFPGGRGRTEVPVPCVVAEIDVDVLAVEVRSRRDAEGAVREGGTHDSAGADDADGEEEELIRMVGSRVDDALCNGRGANVVSIVGGSGGQLYSAAVEARARVDASSSSSSSTSGMRDDASGSGSSNVAVDTKVLLLVGDDAGAAAAAGADGVLLSRGGVPIVVARRLLGDEGTKLVGKRCQSLESCLEAVKDGADVVVADAGEQSSGSSGRDDDAVLREVRSATSVPVLVSGPSAATRAARADGAVLRGERGELDAWKRALMRCREGARDAETASSGPASISGRDDTGDTPTSTSSTVLAPSSAAAACTALIAEERELLERVLELLVRATPDMDEIQLLRDGVESLDSPFLVVVVGEFNSGKSTVINAVLGAKYLECGVVPTTNEIAMLRYGSRDVSELDKDGRLVRSLPADVLRTVTVVDTPGTNVILDRQQRLTEEYVPRADLVLFVLSADRPLTESEVAFMKYIRQWGKKMLFVVNKIDLLGGDEEIAEVEDFVRKNVDRVLGLSGSDVRVLPLCAKKALAARENAENASSLSTNSGWRESGFGGLQTFICDFLGVDIETGRMLSAMDAEAERLKLSTPLTLGAALLDSCDDAVRARVGGLRAEVDGIELRLGSLKQYVTEVERDSASAERKVRKTIDAAVERAQELVDSILDVSNIQELVSTYIAGDARRSLGPAFSGVVVGGGMDILKEAISRRRELVERSGVEHVDKYGEYLTELRRREGVEEAMAAHKHRVRNSEDTEKTEASSSTPSTSSVSDSDAGAAPSTSAIATTTTTTTPSSTGAGADGVIDAFRLDAAELLLEQELRDSAQYCAVAAAGAAALGNLAGHFAPTGFDDVLALLLTGVGAYVGLLSLPLRRFQTKEKVRKMANGFRDELCASLANEAQRDIEERTSSFEDVLLPAKAMLNDDIHALEALLSEREERSQDVALLLDRVQST